MKTIKLRVLEELEEIKTYNNTKFGNQKTLYHYLIDQYLCPSLLEAPVLLPTLEQLSSCCLDVQFSMNTSRIYIIYFWLVTIGRYIFVKETIQ